MRAAFVAALVMLGLAAAAAAPIQKIRNNLFVVRGTDRNTAVFVTRTGVVLVDTMVPGDGQAIVDAVRLVSDNPVTMIIPTSDGAAGAAAHGFFAASVEIVTRERGRARATFGRGREQIDVYWFETGDQAQQAVVVFPGVRTMYVGDLQRLGSAVDRVARDIRDVDTVIAADGDVTSWAAFRDSASAPGARGR
jgi:hypothetical protein